MIAVASEVNHETLRGWGAEPVSYEDGLEERIRSLAPDGVQALLEAYGGGYVELALGMGAPADRIETIIDFEAVRRHGVHGDGMSTQENPRSAVVEVAGKLASGELELPIKARFPLEQVADAYREVENRHGLGKVVLEVSTPQYELSTAALNQSGGSMSSRPRWPHVARSRRHRRMDRRRRCRPPRR